MMNRNLQRLYYEQELSQVRQAVHMACGNDAQVQAQSLDIDPNAILVSIKTPDDVRLRNAITEALGGYDLVWHEEMVGEGELTFSLDIGYWRIMKELAQVRKPRPRLGWLRRWFAAARGHFAATKEFEKAFAQMEEGD